jgi:multiple sugar transport system permease protein
VFCRPITGRWWGGIIKITGEMYVSSQSIAKVRIDFKSKKVKENIFAYLMLAPDVIGLALFIFLPVVIAFYVSLHEWNALEPMKYIGLKNYITLMSDGQWWTSLKTTTIYTFVFVPMVFCTSLLIATFINSIPGKAQEIFRTLYFVPYAVSTVVAALMWTFMFDEQRGFINGILKIVGIEPQTFLGNPKQALFCIAIISAWMIIGYYSVIFIAALKDIPVSYYEAAKLDGANAVQIFRSITFPMLREVSTFVLVVTTIASFQIFDQVKIMTNGGPAEATNVSVFYIYTNCFEYMKLGYSSSMAFVLFLIIFTLSLLQLKVTKGKSDE